MGTTADKLNKLLETKAAIKEAIQNKGVEVTDEDTFASYPEKINAIEAGGGGYSMVDIVNMATANGTNGYYAFYKWAVSELELNSLDTSAMTDMSYMFHYCSDLTSLNLSGFNTSNVTNVVFKAFKNSEYKEVEDIKWIPLTEIENYQIVLLELTKAEFCVKKELRDWLEIFNAKDLENFKKEPGIMKNLAEKIEKLNILKR